jgi:hypothetical protein
VPAGKTVALRTQGRPTLVFVESDTRPDAAAVHRVVLAARTGEQRIQDICETSLMMREVARSGVRNRHPEYDERGVELALHRLWLGDDVARRVWPASAAFPP